MGGGAKREAEAKQKIAQEQLRQAEAERAYSIEKAEVSTSELENQRALNQIRDQVLGQGSKEIEFLQRGLDLREPGSSAFGQGVYSAVLLRQRQAQQQLLESQLRQRLGAGYATSSAGMAALNQFRQQTADLATSMIPGVLQSQTAAISSSASYEDMLKKRQIAASQGSSTVPYQGANEIYNLEMARNNQNLWGTAGRVVGGIVGGVAAGVATGGNPMAIMGGASLGASAFGGGGQSSPDDWYNIGRMGQPAQAQPGQFGNLVTQPNQGWQQGFGFGNYSSQLPTSSF